MDSVHVCDFRGADDAVDPEIAVGYRGFADTDSLIGQLDMHGIGIRFGVNGYRADIHLLAGANDTHRNFSTIRDKDFFKHKNQLFDFKTGHHQMAEIN